MIKSFVLSVSLGTGCYRHIQISASATLYQLHKLILSSFGFEDDHAHAFFMDNHVWSPYSAYFSMEMRGDERLTKSYTLKKLNLQKGDKFKYLFDFGDEWCFQCKVLRCLEEKIDIPGVIRSVGAAPEQYQEFDAINDAFPEIYDYEQIMKLFEQLPIEKEIVDNVHKYFEAASHLYGIVPLGVVLKIYNEQNPPISEKDFLMIAEAIRHEANDFVILGAEALYDEMTVPPIDREIISVYIMECGPETYYELAEMQRNKAFVVLPKERFLAYSDPDYIRVTPQSEKMLKYLKKRESRSLISAEETLGALQMLIWLEAPLRDVMGGLAENSFRFKSANEAKEFIALYQDLNNHTRKISNRGQTPEEVLKTQTEIKESQAAQPIRSDPNQLSLFGEDE